MQSRSDEEVSGEKGPAHDNGQHQGFLERALNVIKGVILSPFKLLKAICLVTGAVVLSGLFVLTLMTWSFFNSLPNIEGKTYSQLKKEATLHVHSHYEKTKKREKYFWTPLSKVNRELLYAIVVSEDGTYFEHNGINFNAMIDSLAHNIRKREYDRGASTITQQVVKNVYLTQEKSILRKLKEILIARELEKRFSKNEILEIYLNIAQFGPKLYGVGMASYHFFARPPKEMTAAQGAYLALMLPSPRRHYFSIYQNRYLAPSHKKKLKRILRDMRYLGYLSPQQYQDYTSFNFLKSLRD